MRSHLVRVSPSSTAATRPSLIESTRCLPRDSVWTACRLRCGSVTRREDRPEPELLVLDTSGLVALLDRDDAHHDAVADVITADVGPLYLSPFVLQEVDYLVSKRIGTEPALRVLEDVAAGAYQLEAFGTVDLAVALAVMRRYLDLSLGLADASIVVIAARHGTDRILTLDERDFRTLRPLQGGSFTLLPADA